MWTFETSRLRADNDVALGQGPDYSLRHQLRRFIKRPQMNLRRFRRLIRRIETREILDRASFGLGVQALCIAFHAFLDRRVDEYLDKFSLSNQIPHAYSLGAVGRNERTKHNQTRFGQ